MTDWHREITSWLKDLRLPQAREAEIVEELAQHVEDRYRELITSGVKKKLAAQTALAELRGDGLLIEELQQIESTRLSS
jgi:putative ABC transport system permease protein